jgi:hypothetical protein
MLFITTIKFSISQSILEDWLIGVVDFSIIFSSSFFFFGEEFIRYSILVTFYVVDHLFQI